MQPYIDDYPVGNIEPYDGERIEFMMEDPDCHVRVFNSMSKACAAKRVAKRRKRNKRARKARKQGRR